MDKRRPEWLLPMLVANLPARYGWKFTFGGSESKSPRKNWNVDALEAGILSGNRTLLSRAITMVESNSGKHFEQAQELLKKLLPYSGKSIRIGITEFPGG
jgi:hypothetical protein